MQLLPTSILIFFLFSFSPLIYGQEQAAESIAREQISYLLKGREINQSIHLYQQRHLALKQHDFELLEHMATIILEDAARNGDPEQQLASLLGLKVAGVSSSVDILNLIEEGIKSNVFETELFALQFLGSLQDDLCESLLTKAMHSDFLLIRMEAAYLLSLRKSPRATGQIEALMHRLPFQLRSYFPHFFAMIGTRDATELLKQLLEDREAIVRISALLSCAAFERDDLLPQIRSLSTHGHPAQQEATATVLGELRDSKSLPFLKKLSQHSITSLRLSALRSLHLLGDSQAPQEIMHLAKQKDLFAIALLGEIPNSEETLAILLNDEDLQVRLNAALSLLYHKDSRGLHIIEEILIRDTRGLGFQPHYSLGSSLMAWKALPSIKQLSKEFGYDGEGLSLAFKEEVLRSCLELPEAIFLQIASRLFASKQTELIPFLVSLLENLQTPSAKALLQEQAVKAGAPLIRSYSNLALFRLKEKGPYETRLYEWIEKNKDLPLLRFRPVAPRHPSLKHSSFELTSEESSRLFIECLEAFANRHEEKSIDMLLNLLKTKNSKNRCIFAGILLRAIQ